MENQVQTVAKSSANKGKLLIVDDEKVLLIILQKMFQNQYDVKIASSGDEALKILKEGFDAGVILSDQRMPGMDGSEMLEKSMAIVPNATRIILTGYSNPKDIIACINQGHAYMYLTKPAEEIALIQTIRLGFDHYNSTMINKRLVTELKKQMSEMALKNQKLTKLMQDNRKLFTQTVQAIAGLVNTNEKYYFTSHAKSVAVIVKSMCEETELSPENASLALLASLLLNSLMIGMPKKFILLDPFELENNEERIRYFEYFNNAIAILNKIEPLAKHAITLGQIWEHHDGSGLPEGFSGKSISKEAQIIALAHIYHSNVYRVNYDDIDKLENGNEFVQTKEITKQRHNETIKYLYRKATWFDFDLFNIFQNLIKSRKCAALIPIEDELTIHFSDNLFRNIKTETVPVPIQEEQTKGADSFNISTEKTNNEVKLVEKNIKVDKLESGMVVGQNVVTKSGMLVVRQDTPLEPSVVKNIRQLASNGMLSDMITVMVEEEN